MKKMTFTLLLSSMINCQVQANEYLPSMARDTKALLGTGYNQEEESFVGDCVQGDIDWVGVQESNIQFERSLSNNELTDSFGFSAGTKVRYGVISAQAAAKFASESSSDSYSESTIYKAQYHFKNAKLKFTGLTNIGEKARGNNDYSWENWKTTCGHSYVDQVKLGAMILISAKIDFATKEDKNAFSAEFNIKGPAFSAQGALTKASKRFGKSASVTIRAYQIGGKVSRLSGIFSNQTKPKNNEVHSLLTCSMEKIQDCLQVLDQALKYATDINNPEAFPNQIKETQDIFAQNGPAHLGYVIKPWTNLSYYPPPALLEKAILDSRKNLSFLFEEQLKYKNRIYSLKSSPFRLSPRQLESIDAHFQTVNTNINKIAQAIPDCYKQMENCPNAIDQLTKQIQKINENDFQILPEIFAQYCDLYLLKKISKNQFNTMQAIMDYIHSENDMSVHSDICAATELIFEQDGTLDISYKNIKDFRVLKTLADYLYDLNISGNYINNEKIKKIGIFPKVQNLRIMNNDLTGLDFLKNFPNLRHLYAAQNSIYQILDLKYSPNIQKIWLANNLIEDLDGINFIPKVEELIINNNMLNNISLLTNLNLLHTIDLSFNKISDFEVIFKLPRLKQFSYQSNLVDLPPILKNKFPLYDL